MPKKESEREFVGESSIPSYTTKKGAKVIEIKRAYDYLIVDGKYYKELEQDGRMFWEQIQKKDINKLDKKNKEIVEAIHLNLDREKVLAESLRKLLPEDIEKLWNLIYTSERKYKAKTREDHCVDMKVGNFIIPIVN